MKGALVTGSDVVGEFLRLYAKRSWVDGPTLAEFIKNLPVATLSDEQRAQLEEEITEEELLKALAQIQTGKALGPNGFPVKFL